MVGSHADKVKGGEIAVRSRCEAMAKAVHTELEQYRAAQQQELAELSRQVRSEAAPQRARQLQRVLSQPLRLSPGAVAVSAKTGRGFGELRRVVLNAAFDQQAFPSFGSRQPGSYSAIHEKLLRCHPEEPSLTWDAMQQSAELQSDLEISQLDVRFVASKLSSDCEALINSRSVPEPESQQGTDAAAQLSIVGVLQCEGEGWFSDFEDKRVELSCAGVLTVEGRAPANLTKPGTRIGQPWWSKTDRPFCVQIDCVDPDCELVLDMGNAEQQQRWLNELRAVANISAAQHYVYRNYTFAISTGEVELKRFTIDHGAASIVHKKLQAACVAVHLEFPGSIFDATKDFIYTEENWRQRAQDMERYYADLIVRQGAISHPVFRANFDFDFDELKQRHSRVSTKVRTDPELLRRAMMFLAITGTVLHPQYDNAPALAERVFLRPQWLVDIMKELVRHDLDAEVEKIPADDEASRQLKELGQRFCSKGELDRRFLPWLWRNLEFSLARSEDEVSFVLELLTQLGLLTRLPEQDEPLWLLPLRLPSNIVYGREQASDSAGTQAAVDVLSSPAQHEELAQFASALSTEAVDEVRRGYEFHQPLPSGLMAVVISRCAKLSSEQTSVWRQGIRTLMKDRASGARLEVSMFQNGLSRIDFMVRCAAGSRHDQCLQKMKLFETELVGVLSERWHGCTYTELCVGPHPRSQGVRLIACQHAADRGEVVATVDGEELLLACLLGSGATSLDSETQEMATTLMFCRAISTGLCSDVGSTATCRKFCEELDVELDNQLGGTYDEGCRWSTQLQEGSGLVVAAAGEDLAWTEAVAVVEGKSRACALLGALGRLYERSHVLLDELAGLQTMRDVFAGLLSPFGWLRREPLLRLAESSGLRDVEATEILKVFELVTLTPAEGVPPAQHSHVVSVAQLEPEPEPEPELQLALQKEQARPAAGITMIVHNHVYGGTVTSNFGVNPENSDTTRSREPSFLRLTTPDMPTSSDED